MPDIIIIDKLYDGQCDCFVPMSSVYYNTLQITDMLKHTNLAVFFKKHNLHINGDNLSMPRDIYLQSLKLANYSIDKLLDYKPQELEYELSSNIVIEKHSQLPYLKISFHDITHTYWFLLTHGILEFKEGNIEYILPINANDLPLLQQLDLNYENAKSRNYVYMLSFLCKSELSPYKSGEAK